MRKAIGDGLRVVFEEYDDNIDQLTIVTEQISEETIRAEPNKETLTKSQNGFKGLNDSNDISPLINRPRIRRLTSNPAEHHVHSSQSQLNPLSSS